MVGSASVPPGGKITGEDSQNRYRLQIPPVYLQEPAIPIRVISKKTYEASVHIQNRRIPPVYLQQRKNCYARIITCEVINSKHAYTAEPGEDLPEASNNTCLERRGR
jgi:hypothetical protein